MGQEDLDNLTLGLFYGSMLYVYLGVLVFAIAWGRNRIKPAVHAVNSGVGIGSLLLILWLGNPFEYISSAFSAVVIAFLLAMPTVCAIFGQFFNNCEVLCAAFRDATPRKKRNRWTWIVPCCICATMIVCMLLYGAFIAVKVVKSTEILIKEIEVLSP